MGIDEDAEKLGIDRAFYLELIGDFVNKAMEDMVVIAAAIETEKTDDAVMAVHSIKGAAGSLNFTETAEIAEKVEELLLGRKMNELSGPVRLLKQKIEAASNLSK